jgi:hypothetical protein
VGREEKGDDVASESKREGVSKRDSKINATKLT